MLINSIRRRKIFLEGAVRARNYQADCATPERNGPQLVNDSDSGATEPENKWRCKSGGSSHKGHRRIWAPAINGEGADDSDADEADCDEVIDDDD